MPADSLGILLGRRLITTAEYHAARDVAELLATARRSLGLANGSCHSFWLAILTGGHFGGHTSNSAEWAIRTLARLRSRLADPLTATLVFAVASGELPPLLATPWGLQRLRSGLDCVARSWSLPKNPKVMLDDTMSPDLRAQQ